MSVPTVERSCRADRVPATRLWSAILTATDHAGHAGHPNSGMVSGPSIS